MFRHAALVCAALVLGACSKPADQVVRDAASSQPAQAAKDSFLAAAIKAKVTAIDLDSATSVRVQVRAGHVTLSGQVREASKKEAMVKATKEIPGVDAVSDELAVNPNARPATKDFSDAALIARVSAALAAQTGINAFSVHVRAHDGVVTIEGRVPTSAIKDTMLETARKVPDVRQVISNVRVAP